MILNGGILEHRRIVSRATVEVFTRRADVVPDSSRALGWDTKSEEGYSSAGSLFSPGSFGHTGFTGTSIWFDPDRDLFLILLTNRVHPTREQDDPRRATGGGGRGGASAGRAGSGHRMRLRCAPLAACLAVLPILAVRRRRRDRTRPRQATGAAAEGGRPP